MGAAWKVETREDVANVWSADRRIVTLTAAWERAIRAGDQLQAVKIRHEINGIKQDIRQKYDVII